MTGKQENKLSMYLAVRLILTTFNGLWSGIGAFAAAVGEFDVIITSIRDHFKEQQKTSKGVTDDKGSLRETLASKAMEIIGTLKAFASATDYRTLFENVNFTESDLVQVRDTLLVERCRLVAEEANANIGEMAEYNIDATKINALETLIDKFEAAIPTPRGAIVNKKEATGALVTDLEDGDKLVEERLDGLMEQFRNDEEEFYSEYHSAREIIDVGTRTTNLEVLVIAAASGEPVAEATLVLAEHELEILTNLEGIGRFERILPGLDVLTVSKAGWITQEINVRIERGRTVTVEVTLEQT